MCFSDGVGRISAELLEATLERVPFVREARGISAIQVGPISIQIRVVVWQAK